MNAWFDRLHKELARMAAEGGVPSEAVAAVQLAPEEAQALLDLARDAAHISGARQYAPLATYLAGRAAQIAGPSADLSARVAIIRAVAQAVQTAGPSGEQP